jgi:hypothetical protein
MGNCKTKVPWCIIPSVAILGFNEAVMQTTVSGTIDNDKILSSRIQRAKQILEDVIGPTHPHVSAEWRFVNDANNRQMLLLILSDFTGARMEARFAPDDLANEGHLRAKFYRIWGDLLQFRSHRQLQELSGRGDASGL